MARLLLVDDERDLLDPLLFALERDGHTCSVATSGSSALEQLETTSFDLVVLDLMLPDVSGAEICRRIRESPETRFLPVVIVSARGDEFDRVVGFELGADDYVTKPFSLRELTLRVNALLRRSRQRVDEPTAPLRHGDLVLDFDAMKARLSGEELDLTALEYRIVGCFLRNIGKALTRADIRSAAWGPDYRIGERAVDTNVKRLRRKLRHVGDCIETVRGVGYRWNAD